MTPDPIQRRGARARDLSARYPAAQQVLTFYAKLADYQATLVAIGADASQQSPTTSQLVSMVPSCLEWLESEAPPALVESALALRQLSDQEWSLYFSRAFAEVDPGDASDATALFVAEVIVQAWAERELAPSGAGADASTAIVARCPACGCAPVVGVLREEGHGAKRGLVCARCSTEWPYPRISCPGCGEQEFDALPRYSAEPYDHIRIDACDRCRRYLKTVDLTKDGLAVPQVDDLASLALDLWAREHGYRRLRDNLLRT